MEGFPRGLSAGGRTASGVGRARRGPGTRSAQRRPSGALWRLPRAAVVGGGAARAPRELPLARRGHGAARPFPLVAPTSRLPARPRRRRGALITIREAEAAGAELGGGGGGDSGGRGGRSSSSLASRGNTGATPGQQTPPPPPAPRVPRRPGPAAAPGGSTWSSSSSSPADSPRGPVPAPPRRGRRRPPLPGAWPRARASPPPPPPPPLPGEREPKGGRAGGRRDGGSGRAQGTGGRGRRGRGGAAGRGAARDVTSSGEERPGPGRRGGADPGESVAGAGGCGLAEAAGRSRGDQLGPGRPGQGAVGAARPGSGAKAGGACCAALRSLLRLQVASGPCPGFLSVHPCLPATRPTLHTDAQDLQLPLISTPSGFDS